MADILYSGGNDIGTFSDVASPGSDGTSLNTGDLRRRYNFGNRVSELAIARDPFFRILSKAGKVPTDDPTPKFTERRGSWHKRYAYVVGFNNGSSDVTNDATVKDTSNAQLAAGASVKLYMATDYKSSGNIQNVYGQSSGAITIGGSGTRPAFFIPKQLIKVPLASDAGGGYGADLDYVLVRVDSVDDGLTVNSAEVVRINGTVVRAASSPATSVELTSFSGNSAVTTAYSKTIHSGLEPMRSYVVGTVFDKGSGIPETWKDQPFSTGFGQCQIWKTTMAMDNTDRATVLKYAPNEWARIWKEKLIEHKWDIEQSITFGSQSTTYRTTQGAVDFVLNNGNIFSLDTASKTIDDFLDDLSRYVDPRYGPGGATVFFCSTAIYNWVHKLGGFFVNNIGLGDNGNNFNRFSADLAVTGRKKVLGLDSTTISTVYGDMNLIRNIHLDGTGVGILALDMRHIKYRPLVGNGLNRDTAIYVGVQTLENTGVDRRVDQIITEACMQFDMPERHAVWTTT